MMKSRHVGPVTAPAENNESIIAPMARAVTRPTFVSYMMFAMKEQALRAI
jgi:hypothetical protein